LDVPAGRLSSEFHWPSFNWAAQASEMTGRGLVGAVNTLGTLAAAAASTTEEWE
jgi:hypothetical protein